MAKNEELTCFALLIKEWNSFYSFGVNRRNPKLKSDLDYNFYDKTISLELICKTYQDESNLKASNNEKVAVHFVPKSEDHFINSGYENIGILEVSKKYDNRIIVSIPITDLNHILQMLQNKKQLGILFTSTSLKYNKASIKSFDIMTDFKPKEF